MVQRFSNNNKVSESERVLSSFQEIWKIEIYLEMQK